MQKPKQRRVLWLVVLAVALGMIGGVWSYFHNDNQVVNRLTTIESGITLKEVFNPKDQWFPGETKEKKVSFYNSGETTQLLRFKTAEKWYTGEGAEWSFTGTSPLTVNYSSAISGWTKIGEYYYCNQVLQPDTATAEIVLSLLFDKSVGNMEAPDFSGKKCSLTVILESVEPDAVGAAWSNVTATISGSGVTWAQTAP